MRLPARKKIKLVHIGGQGRLNLSGTFISLQPITNVASSSAEVDVADPGSAASGEGSNGSQHGSSSTHQKKIRGSNHNWLAQYPWLRHDRLSGHIYCADCRKAGMDNTLARGCTSFQILTLQRHDKLPDHEHALRVPELQKQAAEVQAKVLSAQRLRFSNHFYNAYTVGICEAAVSM